MVLVLLAQILRPYGKKLGADLSPAADMPKPVDALQELLSLRLHRETEVWNILDNRTRFKSSKIVPSGTPTFQNIYGF